MYKEVRTDMLLLLVNREVGIGVMLLLVEYGEKGKAWAKILLLCVIVCE